MCHLTSSHLKHRHRSQVQGKHNHRLRETGGSHLHVHVHGSPGLVQMSEGGHEHQLASWEQDLVNDDDDEMLQEEIAKERTPAKLSQSISLGQAQRHATHRQRQLQALAAQAEGAESAVEGARRAEARATSRLHSIQQQVQDLNKSIAAASADASRLLLESQIEANQTAAAFQTAEHLALSLEQTKRKYHLASDAKKTLTMDLNERQNDESDQKHLVEQIQKEVSNLITHARHVRSNLANLTSAKVLEIEQGNGIHATSVAGSTSAGQVTVTPSLQSASPVSTKMRIPSVSAIGPVHLLAKKISIPSTQVRAAHSSVRPRNARVGTRLNVIKASQPAVVGAPFKASKHAPVVGKARSPPRVLPMLTQHNNLVSFGNPVTANSQLHSVHAHGPSSNLKSAQIPQKGKEPLVSENDYRGTSIQSTLSNAISKTLSFVQWAFFGS